MTLAPERLKAVQLMEQTAADQAKHGNWTYRAVRPQVIITDYTGQRVESDCSDGVRIIARLAGIKDDPAGNGYQSYGNSSSIWLHLHHIDLTEVEPGDAGTFGYSSGEHHAFMFHSKTANGWLVWNMGTQGQPVIVSLLHEIQGHAGMTLTCCKANVEDPPLTPIEKLHAKTGFYSWVAWKLGEGPWKHYGAASKTVRPAVPRVIPARWWKDYAAFLLRRKKANVSSSDAP